MSVLVGLNVQAAAAFPVGGPWRGGIGGLYRARKTDDREPILTGHHYIQDEDVVWIAFG